MGCKRPFDDEEFQELPYKHSRQLDVNNKMAQFSEIAPLDTVFHVQDTLGDWGGLNKHQWHEASAVDAVTNELMNSVNKEFATSAPLSWVTKSFSEEGAGFDPTTSAHLFLEPFDYDFPQRKFFPFEDSYSSFLDHSRRKQVPLGPNHQATLPAWDRNVLDGKAVLNGNSYSDHVELNDIVDNDKEEKWMGTCVIPMPDSDLLACNVAKFEQCCTGCDCLDEGSVRCVQQHVLEAREKLLKSLGYEKFAKLGLCEMGEEVSCKWSEEEEQVFHEVVYSNPVSLGRNFWKHLSAVFPSRTKQEIVCYYFNVFVLCRRAIQNRSELLDTDSDDDEWHGSYGGSDKIRISEEDEDSAIESPVDQEKEVGEDSSDEGDDGGGGDDDDDDGDVGDSEGDVLGEVAVSDHVSDAHVAKSFGECGFDAVVPHMGKMLEEAEDDFNVEDDSCTSFEIHPDMVDSCGTITMDAGNRFQLSGVKTDNIKALSLNQTHYGLQYSKFDGCNDQLGHLNLLDSCDAKVWDTRYLSPIKGVELLPTCNIIEEIFGHGTWDTKTSSHDQDII